MQSKESFLTIHFKTRANNLLRQISTKNKKEIVLQFMREIKQSKLRKETIQKGNITTIYVEYKYKNAGTSALIYPQNVETSLKHH